MAHARVKLTVDQVLAWRLRRQFLDPPGSVRAGDVVCRLCGVQAQVTSAAQLAVATRQAEPRLGEVAQALESHKIVKTWAMRGTLHLLPAGELGAYLSLIAAAQTWTKQSWQRTFVTAGQLDAITAAVREVLHDRVLTREQLVAEVLKLTSDATLAEHLSSGWSAVLKPLAWQGYLIQGPAEGNRITFTSPQTWLPDWARLPSPEEAAVTVIPAYLGAHGPATPQAFDQWLTRGASRKAALRSWFADLSAELVEVEVKGVDGVAAYARAADIDDLASAVPSTAVRLLPSFDQYVLGPGTNDTSIISAERRPLVSRKAGWISPVVVAAGRVVGTWDTADGEVVVTLFGDTGTVPVTALRDEVARLGSLLGTDLRLSVRTG